MKKLLSIASVLVGLFIIATSAALSGCSSGVVKPQSKTQAYAFSIAINACSRIQGKTQLDARVIDNRAAQAILDNTDIARSGLDAVYYAFGSRSESPASGGAGLILPELQGFIKTAAAFQRVNVMIRAAQAEGRDLTGVEVDAVQGIDDQARSELLSALR